MDGDVLEKPRDAAHAVSMLQRCALLLRPHMARQWHSSAASKASIMSECKPVAVLRPYSMTLLAG